MTPVSFPVRSTTLLLAALACAAPASAQVVAPEQVGAVGVARMVEGQALLPRAFAEGGGQHGVVLDEQDVHGRGWRVDDWPVWPAPMNGSLRGTDEKKPRYTAGQERHLAEFRPLAGCGALR